MKQRAGKLTLLNVGRAWPVADRCSIDSETNKVMQELISEAFKDITVISVEHTLENILHFDRIAVFDAGVLVEFDTPAKLLARSSAFKALYSDGNV